MSTRLSVRSLRLVAGVFSSWETFATKSRRILLTRCSSTTLTGSDSPRPGSVRRSSICLLAGLYRLPLLDGGHLTVAGVLEVRLEAVAQAPGGVDVLVVTALG